MRADWKKVIDLYKQ
jgi:hypothetical protein